MQISDLPATYQDAIKMCQRIGIYFIWIDSLCIIQDNLTDWELESAKMGPVYQYSYITITASRAANDTSGFLHPRTRDLPSDLLTYSSHGSLDFASCRAQYFNQHEESFCSFDPKLISRLHQLPIQGAPLSQRAWVVQERYLARRTIFFDEKQMYWKCDQMIAGEDDNVLLFVSGSHSTLIKDLPRDTPSWTLSHSAPLMV
jgi:hypothetical protein